MSETKEVRVVRVLERVRLRLDDCQNWTKGTSARTQSGAPTYALDPEAVCWCTVGAIRIEAPEDDDFRQAVANRLMDFVKWRERNRDVSHINDAQTTKHAHILKWLDTVIAYDTKRLGL